MIDLKKIFQSEGARQIEDAEKSLDLTGDIARTCLATETFKTYRRDYEETEAHLVDTMILYTKNFVESDKGDLTKYALTMVRLMTRLQDLRYLVKRVESDAKKGIDNE